MSEAAPIEGRKLAAVMAAIGAYMAGEEEAVAEAMTPPAVRVSPAVVWPWAAGGRRRQMEQRWLMQMRTFR